MSGFRLQLLMAEQVQQQLGTRAVGPVPILDVVNAEKLSIFEGFPAHRAFPNLHGGQAPVLH